MNNKPAFGLLELIVAIAIIGMMAALIIPNLGRLQPRYEREQFVARLTALVQFARQQAIISHKLHRVFFALKKRTAFVERAVDGAQKGKEFERVSGASVQSEMRWTEQFDIRQFMIEGVDEMDRVGSKQTAEVWFFVVPEGLTQEVIINILDTKETIDGRQRRIGLVLNPFSAQFDVYDTFQK